MPGVRVATLLEANHRDGETSKAIESSLAGFEFPKSL